MAKFSHLPNAPIYEAVVDIRCVLPESFDFTQLTELSNSLSKEFPVIDPIASVQLLVNQSPNEKLSQQVIKENIGYALKSENSSKILQLRMDGFTLSKMKPYEDWTLLINEAKSFWQRYIASTNPLLIPRIAIRYINHINIKFAKDLDLDDYFNTAPKIYSAKLPQNIDSFNTTIVLADSGIDARASITLSYESNKQPDPNSALFVFDIDAFKFSEKGFDNSMWDDFADLRTFKNNIFFEFLTDKTVDLYK